MQKINGQINKTIKSAQPYMCKTTGRLKGRKNTNADA